MHSTGVAIACLLVAAASVTGFNAPSSWILVVLAVSVAVVGIPHGALDHLTGRELLSDRFPRSWALVFFPAYLGVSMIVVAGWFLIPLLTVIGFFLISAWHFGLEDDRSRLRSGVADATAAVAVGGMVIWIPMLTQSEQVAAILESVIPAGFGVSISAIVGTSWTIACLLTPMAAVVIARDLWNGDRGRAVRNLSFTAMFAVSDVLLSFGIYFCSWHSVRGLARLAREHRKTPYELALVAAPLSFGAISLAALGMWIWSSGQPLSEALSRTLFVALSAMAVPHLLLHEPITHVGIRSDRGKPRQIATMEPV